MHSSRATFLSLSIVLLLFAASGCGSDSSDADTTARSDEPTAPQRVDIESPWARPAPTGGTSALYMTLVNGTSATDTLKRVDVALADTAEIHETYRKEGNVMGMRPIGPVPIAPKSRITLEPGGRHVMLLNLRGPLTADSTASVTVTFANAGSRRIQVPIQMRPPQ